MAKKKVSIVLPVYNGADHVKNAIESVLNQEYDNIELIIVNDCSTDNTLEVVSSYANESSVRIISNKVNKKLPQSLNIGFRETTGEYLTWTSDDNRYHSDAILKMVSVLENNTDIDLVYADFTKYDMKGNVIEKINLGEPSDIRFGSCMGACFLYRRSLAEKAGEYNPDAFLAEDYEFFLRCYQVGKFFHLEEDLYDYGCHDASLTATRMIDIAKQTALVTEMHWDYLLSQCISQDDKNRFFSHYLSLLQNPDEKRSQIYEMDKAFLLYDLGKRICCFPKYIFDYLLRIVRKIR